MSFLKDAYIDDAVSGNESSTRKRRRDEGGISRAIDRRPFTIQTEPSDPFSQPRTLTPLCLLSRAHLPLAYLDTAQDGSRLFAAVIQLLEICHEDQDDTNVLIVEDKRASRLYAVERVQVRRYALCRLRVGVKEQDIMARAKLEVPTEKSSKKRRALQASPDDPPWWTSASVDAKSGGGREVCPTGRHPKLHMKNAADSTPAALSSCLPMQHDGAFDHTPDPEAFDAMPSTTTPLNAMEELARQYLDTVYLTRTPLSYFAKGPLARARTAFSKQPSELVSFLRGAILSSSVMDKKFRDTIAGQVKELPMFEPEASAVKPKARKKRKWKPKRDKSGCFVDEKDHIEQWWRSDDDAGSLSSSADSIDTVLRRRTPRLRNRETFLQIILILETLALEKSIPVVESFPVCEAQESRSQAVEFPLAIEGKKPRRKKDLDISTTLESLIDRLCIWHSLEANSPVKPNTNGSGGAPDQVNDDLKTFASEVIMPFYGSRIPEQASATSKKLGGPALPTPGKKLSAAPRKPGEPAVRQGPEKVPRQPLGRVSTDSLNRTSSRPPILHRSATDSDALRPLIKREHIEAPAVLDGIPSVKHRAPPIKAGPQKRVSLLDQMSANRREVDLSAVSKANELKMRKNAKIQEQLRNAIITLKKPNRTLASEDVAKSTDESFAKAMARGKTGGNVRKIVEKGSNDATPRVVKATPAPRRRTLQRSEKSTSMVPSSSTRLFARPEDLSSSSVAVPQTGHRPRHTSNVEDTPSRGFAHFMPKGLARPPGTLLESPTASRTAPISETPSRPVSTPSFAGASVMNPPARNTGFAGRLESCHLVGVASSRFNGILTNDDVTDSTLYANFGWESDDNEELD